MNMATSFVVRPIKGSGLSWVTHGKIFVVCLWHTANYQIPVVHIVGACASLQFRMYNNMFNIRKYISKYPKTA